MSENDIAALVSAANKLDQDRADLAAKLEREADRLAAEISKINDPAERKKMAENHRMNAEIGAWFLAQKPIHDWLSAGYAAIFIASLDERSKQTAARRLTELNICLEQRKAEK